MAKTKLLMAYPEIRKAAFDILARRENSRIMLSNKLLQRGFDPTEIEVVLRDLERECLQSDRRFAENYSRSKIECGFGPLYIENYLESHGVAKTLINEIMIENDGLWVDVIEAVLEKKFGAHIKKGEDGKRKQIKFLQCRGFTEEQIESVLGVCLEN